MTPEVEQRFERIEVILSQVVQSMQAHQVQMTELREGQALLVQMFAEERRQFQEFTVTVNRHMDQVDRRLNALENQ